MAEQEIRSAAEALLTASSSSSQHNRSPTMPVPNYSINMQPDHLSSTDLATGMRQGGRMSVVRRFFCLFVTFDLLFTLLMWLICIMLTGDEIFNALSTQILHYNIHTSLFDIVMAAISRFVILLLFYGLLYINHWSVIAMTTSGTCAFLIGKVFVYNWAVASSPVFQVLLILTSFVLAWGEAWFLDFRVLPQELQAVAYVQASSVNTERTPLLRKFLQVLPQADEYTESVGNFYSPMESPEGSDSEESSTRRVFPRGNSGRGGGRIQELEYVKIASEILETSWNILNLTDWKLEKTTAEDVIHSRYLTKQNKIFRLVAMVDMPAKELLHLLFEAVESIPSWNPTLVESRRVKVIDDRTDITYQVIAEGAGGVVSSRDFVVLRTWSMKNDCYVLASASITDPAIPNRKKYIRGENGPSCYIMQPIPDQEGRCVFKWLVNTNLNGWIPPFLLDTSFASAMCDFMKYLRSHISRMRNEGVPQKPEIVIKSDR